MIGVDPRDLLIGHERHVYEVRVVETEREGLERQPFVFGRRGFGLFGRDDGNQVLRADAPLTGAIDARFVRDDMSYLKRSGVVIRAYVLRTFMAA